MGGALAFLAGGHCNAEAKNAEGCAGRVWRRARQREAASYPMENKRDYGCAPVRLGGVQGRSAAWEGSFRMD